MYYLIGDPVESFTSSFDLFDAAIESYQMDKTKTVFTWEVVSSFVNGHGERNLVYNVQVKEDDFHEFFTVLETKSPI